MAKTTTKPIKGNATGVKTKAKPRRRSARTASTDREGRNGQPLRSEMTAAASEIRIAPIDRASALVERLAKVEPGTVVRFTELKTQAATFDFVSLRPRDMDAAINERFNELRAIPEMRRLHDLTSNWFGEPADATIRLLRAWGAVQNGEVVAGMVRDPQRCALLMAAQEIVLPHGMTLDEIAGFEWNYRPALAIGDGVSRPQPRASAGRAASKRRDVRAA